MAPFRPSGRSNRSGRSQADHDVFEGLPIKQWRHTETTVGLPQVTGEVKAGDNAWPELPLPRDSHLLSEVTQALLKEARRPRLAKRKEPTEDEKGDDEEEGEKEMQTGFLAKKWSQTPAHLEEPEREYLAKRRKGLPSLHTTLALQAATNIPSTAATRKAKVMKADAQGNTTIYEVLVPEGQVIEGEVKEDAEMPDAPLERAAPGTVIEGVGIANAEGVIVANDLLQPQAPPRRRNMPPKRVKKGGPGRGKKKVMFTAEGQGSTSTPGGTGAPTTPATGDAGAGDAMDIDSARKEGEEGEDGEEDDEDDDDHEDGELSDGEVGGNDTPSRPTDSAFPSEASAPIPSALSSQVKEPEAEEIKPQAPAEKPEEPQNGAPPSPSAEPMEDVQTDSALGQEIQDNAETGPSVAHIDPAPSGEEKQSAVESAVVSEVVDSAPVQDNLEVAPSTEETDLAPIGNAENVEEPGPAVEEVTALVTKEPEPDQEPEVLPESVAAPAEGKTRPDGEREEAPSETAVEEPQASDLEKTAASSNPTPPQEISANEPESEAALDMPSAEQVQDERRDIEVSTNDTAPSENAPVAETETALVVEVDTEALDDDVADPAVEEAAAPVDSEDIVIKEQSTASHDVLDGLEKALMSQE